MKRKKEYISPESSVENTISAYLICETLGGGGTGGPGIAEAKEIEEEEEFIEFMQASNKEDKNEETLW